MEGFVNLCWNFPLWKIFINDSIDVSNDDLFSFIYLRNYTKIIAYDFSKQWKESPHEGFTFWFLNPGVSPE